MKRAILVRFVSVLLLALMLCSAISYYFMGKELLKQNIGSLMNVIHVIDYSLNYEKNLQEEILRLHEAALDKSIRVTVIAEDGEVYADTDASGLENHLEREEIKEALEKGMGYSTRYSDTLEKWMLYVAAVSGEGKGIIRVSVPYTGLKEYLSIIFPMLLLAIAVAFAVAAVIAIRFTNTVTRPLNEISEEMQKVQKEELEFHFKHYKYEELNVISHTTTKLSKEIREYIKQVENERRIRQEFFSNASHELKTPITAIKGYAELLDNGFVQDEETRNSFVKRILKSTENMITLINDILMISRLETKDAEVTLSMVRMAPMVEEVVESVEPVAAEYQVALHVECEPVIIEASAKQMRELLTNLISNGIKYNQPGGQVWIEVAQASDELIIRVKDNGVGISKVDRERIFQRFYRVDKGRSKKSGGTGLGLSIVKHIVEFYDGKVEVYSSLGEGSEFIVSLPMERKGQYFNTLNSQSLDNKP